MGDFVMSLFRYVCGLIDSVVYVLISKLYELFIETSSIILYSQDAMDAIGKRIGLILGIFMLFRVAISLMTYLVSPDKIKDESKGGSRLIKNIIFSLILLVTINPIFEQAYKIQIKVVNSKFVEKIFFGPQAQLPDVDIAYSLYSSFLTPEPEECKDLFDPFVGLSSECHDRIQSITNHKIQEAIANDVLKNHRLDKVLSSYDAINYQVGGIFFFDYFEIISTIAGVVVALMLITFCMDLATRAIKLFFLQVVAPIPIIANIDPDKGSDIFKKWYKECMTTYVSLFIRLIIINFAVFMMTLIRSTFHDVLIGKGPLLTALLIIGCLMFAKQVPKLIENITGIKSEGFTLNPIKKFEEQAALGKVGQKIRKGVTAGAVGAAGGAVGAMSGTGVGSIFSGALSGAIHGKGVTETWKNQASANARMRTARLNGSTFGGRVGQWTSDLLGTGGELADIEREKHAIQDEIDRIDQDIKVQEDAIARIKGTDEYRNRQHEMGQHQAVSDVAVKIKERGISQVRNGEGTAGQRYQEMQRQVERLKHATYGKDANGHNIMFTYMDENGRSITRNFATEADAVEEAERIRQAAEHYAENEGWQEYVTETANTGSDATMQSNLALFDDAHEDAYGTRLNRTDHDYGVQLNGRLGHAKGETNRLQIEGSDDERRIAEYNRNIADLNGQKQDPNDRLRNLSERERVANANKSAIGH